MLLRKDRILYKYHEFLNYFWLLLKVQENILVLLKPLHTKY